MSRTIFLLIIQISLFFCSYASAGEIDCLQCHSDLAEGKSVHAAVSMGCTSCHTAVDATDIPHRIKNKITKGLSAAGSGLCFGCHDKSLFEKKIIHGALGMGCTVCHSPHASSHEKLIKTAMPDLCYVCHDNKPFSNKNVHPPVAAGQCTGCHLPHSSDNARLLDKNGSAVCNTCHDDKSTGKHILAGYGLGDKHPAAGKPDPSHPGQEISCASCHTPHSSPRKYLFADSLGNTGNLCHLCHKKIIVRP